MKCIDKKLLRKNRVTEALNLIVVHFLNDFSFSQFALKNGIDFQRQIVQQDGDLYMGSLDVEPLFTNVLISEAIEIILDKVSYESDVFHGFNRQRFKSFLELAGQDTAFVF